MLFPASVNRQSESRAFLILPYVPLYGLRTALLGDLGCLYFQSALDEPTGHGALTLTGPENVSHRTRCCTWHLLSLLCMQQTYFKVNSVTRRIFLLWRLSVYWRNLRSARKKHNFCIKRYDTLYVSRKIEVYKDLLYKVIFVLSPLRPSSSAVFLNLIQQQLVLWRVMTYFVWNCLLA